MSTPTIRPKCGFDQAEVAEVLRGCMKGCGTDEVPITKELCSLNNQQRQYVAEAFEQAYGKNLIDDLKDELGGDFETVTCALMMKPREYDASELHNAMSGAGTNESTLTEIMVTRSNDEIEQIKEEYEKKYGCSLKDDLKSDTSGYFRRLMISLCTGSREGNEEADPGLAMEDAQKFVDAGEARWGTDECEMNRVLCLRSREQLKETFRCFEELSGKPIEVSIDDEVGGDVGEGYKAIVLAAKNLQDYFAKRAYDAMRGLGTNDNDLIRVIVSRSEVDLEDVKNAYLAMYDQSLADAVASECGGDYKRMLLHILDQDAPYDE